MNSEASTLPKPAKSFTKPLTESAATLMTVADRERFLRLVSAIIFLIFFQTFMIAPLIPSLALQFGVTEQHVGLLVPAYTFPYGIAGLLLGALADRLGRRGLLYFSLLCFPLLGLIMAAAPSVDILIGLRASAGIFNAGIVVISLILIGDLFPKTERGRAVGWIFGAIAGGSAFGSTIAGLLAPLIGWRGLFAVSASTAFLLVLPLKQLWPSLVDSHTVRNDRSGLFAGYRKLLSSARAVRTFGYIFLNGMFHSGVFTWLGVHLHERYGLGDAGIGLALLGYGLPGFLLGPAIGRVVDRQGRRRILPLGLAVGALAALMLIPAWPIAVAIVAATILSLGFDMSHPLMAGISMSLTDEDRGLAMGLNCFAIFGGFGAGSLLFGWLAIGGMDTALLYFGLAELLLAITAILTFRSE
jgi:predicted MFS family arabinose efflux permease